MSRKNKNKLLKKQTRKNLRKIKRIIKNMENRIKESAQNDPDAKGSTKDESNSQEDQKPSTSGICAKRISPKKKNRKCCRNKFKKVLDDQVRKLVKRSVYIIQDNRSPNKASPIKKDIRRFTSIINGRKMIKGKRKCKYIRRCSTLVERVTHSDDDNIPVDKINHNDKVHKDEDVEDDCIVIEPTIEEITIEDDNLNSDDDLPSTYTNNYQSIIGSFKERVSSTPRNDKRKKWNAILRKTEVVRCNQQTGKNEKFFVDVSRGSSIVSVTSAGTTTEYTKLNTLREISTQNLHRKEKYNNEIIDLDSSNIDNNNSTLKRKSSELDDDSVIFVSETNQNDFIPIVDHTPSCKALRTGDSARTPIKKMRTNNLFTRSETKRLVEYNENAYNPSGDEVLNTRKRMVIIDGSNVAFKHGLDQTFSVKGLKIAIEYFEKIGHEVKAVIPQFRMNKSKSTDPDELERLHKTGKIVQTPCKNLPGLTSTSYDDRFILQLAFQLDAVIVSNDNYRDLIHENPAFKKIIENRVIGYTWCNDIFILPKDPYGKWGPTLNEILNRC